MSEHTSQRLLLTSKVAALSEAECREVIDYIEIMFAHRNVAARHDLFDEERARLRAREAANYLRPLPRPTVR